MTGATKAVFLDRDGVLNRAVVRNGKPYPPAGLDELELLPGAREACAALREAGYLLIMVTNQPDVARGKQSIAGVGAMNRFVMDQLGLHDAEVCPHDDANGCDCRKPAPGLLTRSAARWHIDVRNSFMVGDRWRDIEAGRRAGCRTVFIDYGYSEPRMHTPDCVTSSLHAAAGWILNAGRKRGENVKPVSARRLKLFADGADLDSMLKLAADPRIEGFTTNPTLMRKAGIRDYEAFAREVVARIPDRPISFEVFSDELEEMARQALAIATWGDNVNVKVPVTNTRGESTAPVLRFLAAERVRLNVTALMTLAQVERVSEALAEAEPSFVSVFAGRIADTGRDPVPVMTAAVEHLKAFPHLELIWASPRELLNVMQAEATGCHIITATPDLLKKLDLVGKSLDEYSLETVKMFYNDARAAGFTLDVASASGVQNLANALENAIAPVPAGVAE